MKVHLRLTKSNCKSVGGPALEKRSIAGDEAHGHLYSAFLEYDLIIFFCLFTGATQYTLKFSGTPVVVVVAKLLWVCFVRVYL